MSILLFFVLIRQRRTRVQSRVVCGVTLPFGLPCPFAVGSIIKMECDAFMRRNAIHKGIALQTNDGE